MDAYCPYCKEWTTIKLVDNGLGPIEAWGVVKVHSSVNAETSCCNSVGYHDESCSTEITVRDLKEYNDSEKAYYGY